MIVRFWRGWTTAANADEYEELIRSTIFPHILDRGIDGLFRLDLYRRAGEVETEFMTVMWFTNHEAIVRFAGPDWETAVVPASALCFHASRRKRRTMNRGLHRKPRRTSDCTRQSIGGTDEGQPQNNDGCACRSRS
jgi:hypothetical protein